MNPLTKKLLWALAISLGLNLFLLGFGAARLLRPRHAADKAAQLDAGSKALRFFGPQAPALRAQRQAVLAAREAVAQALTRDPFDREALASALDNLRSVTAAGQLKLHEALLDTAAKLPRDEREKLAHSRLLHAPSKH